MNLLFQYLRKVDDGIKRKKLAEERTSELNSLGTIIRIGCTYKSTGTGKTDYDYLLVFNGYRYEWKTSVIFL
jgi:hypothetical protein